MNKIDLSDVTHRHLGKVLQLQAAQNGDTEFLINDQQRITFSQAEDISNRLASGFIALGVSPGDRVCLLMGNRPEMVLLSLALNKIGAIWIPICTDYRGQWLIETLNRSRAHIIISDRDYVGRILEVRDACRFDHLLSVDSIEGPEPQLLCLDELLKYPPFEADYGSMGYGDTSAILWTSGTTGRSKGVMQSHNNWLRTIELGTAIDYPSVTGDIVYCALPLYNTGAYTSCVFRALVQGIGCVIEERFSVSQFMDRIRHFGATQTLALGAMGMFLLNNTKRDDDADNPLKHMHVVPIPPEKVAVFENRFDVQVLKGGYGLSECVVVLNHLHSTLNVPGYALGFPIPDVDVQLFDEDGNSVPDGNAGEICVKPLAPHVLFSGYFDDPEATQQAFRGHWFKTGDIARVDPDTGAYYFVDRKKDVIRFAGRNISSVEVESVVTKHPDVNQVAAFGVPSELLETEEELKIDIVLKPDKKPSAEDICEYINQNAPHYFVPRFLEFVDALPYTPTNKVQKYKLRKQGVSESTWDIEKSNFKRRR